MTILAIGASVTVNLGNDSSCKIFTNGGLASISVTPTSGVTSISGIGPLPVRQTFGPFATGATLVISNQTASLNYTVAGFDSGNVALTGGFIAVANGTTSTVAMAGLGDTLNLTTSPESAAPRYSSYADINPSMIGLEYLWQWYRAWRLNPSQIPNVTLSGDSTTTGVNIATAIYQPAGILPLLARDRGFGITATMAGYSGESTANWLATRLNFDLSGAVPGIYLIRWGLNDPGNGISVNQTITNIRTGLARIRATSGWSASAVGIILMTPNTSSDDANLRGELWHEQIAAGFRQAARDYGAVLVDSYAMLRTARNQVPTSSGSWLDDNLVHPNEDHSMMLMGAVADALFPKALCQMRAIPINLAPASGYSQPGNPENAISRLLGSQVVLSGYLIVPGSTVGAGVTVATISSQHSPQSGAYFVDGYVWSGATAGSAASWQTVPFVIDTSGNLVTMSATTFTVARVYFNKIALNRF